MKRSMTERDDRHRHQQQVDHHGLTMANCLKFLSGSGNQIFEYSNNSSSSNSNSSSSSSQISRVFECKTCNRQFQSFQALGGHRASHKKPRLMGLVGDQNQSHDDDRLGSSTPVKPKTHECSICGLEFAIGQALGGHMRRHRASINSDQNQQAPQLLLGLNVVASRSSKLVPVVKKSNTSDHKITSKRVLFIDLNLTPLENDIKVLQLGNGVPFVDCFL